MSDDVLKALPVPTIDEDEAPPDAPEPEVTDVDAAKAELQALRAAIVDLAAKWEQARAQQQQQRAAEEEVREVIAEAEAEVARLRARIPSSYDPRAAEEGEADVADASVFVEESRAPATTPPPRPRPRKGVLGMEVALYGDFVQVQRLVLGGACQTAGLQEGDIIKTWNGKLIGCQADFVRATSVCGAGIPLNVEVQREGVRGLLTFEVIPKRK